MREENPEQYIELAYESMYRHVELMIELQARGAITFDYGNNIRARAHEYEQSRNRKRKTSNSIATLIALIFPVLFPHISVPYFVKAKDHSAGQH